MTGSIKILYSDTEIAVAVKPQGVPSQSDHTGDAAMPALLSEQLGRPVFPVHRLDRAVGGVMVFACGRRAAAKLCAGMSEGDAVKEYLAVVHGVPENQTGDYRDFLLHVPVKNRTEVVSVPHEKAKEASLSYRLIDTVTAEERFSLLLIRLHTGRTHQIRAQLSSRGMPVAGDGKYGAHDRCALALWSHRLTFRHPVTKKKLVFAEWPEKTMPWNLFADMGIRSEEI